jgi:hypothetical protein
LWAWSYLELHLKWYAHGPYCGEVFAQAITVLPQPHGLRAIGTVLISKFITQEVYENHIDPMTRRRQFCAA